MEYFKFSIFIKNFYSHISQESKDPIFSNMYKVMMSDPKLLVKENEEGLSRAMHENYAYLMESPTLEYYTERYCNVTQVGGFLNERIYAIGMRKGSFNQNL